MLDFYVGQKVVCIDASAGPNYDPSWIDLREGQIYTIRAFGPSSKYAISLPGHAGCDASCLLEGIHRGFALDGIEKGYAAIRFRPLIETDISVFQAMLATNPTTQRDREPALAMLRAAVERGAGR